MQGTLQQRLRLRGHDVAAARRIDRIAASMRAGVDSPTRTPAMIFASSFAAYLYVSTVRTERPSSMSRSMC